MARILSKELIESVRSLGWWVLGARSVSIYLLALAAGAWINHLSSENQPSAVDGHWTEWIFVILLVVTVALVVWARLFGRPSAARHLVLVGQLALAIRSVADRMVLTQRARLAQRDGLVTHVVTNLARAYEDVANVRVQFFELEQQGGIRRLNSKTEWAAGDRVPSDGFDDTTAEGKAIIDWILTQPKSPRLVADTSKAQAQRANADYRTYLSAPVISAVGFDGMLSIDSPSAGSFTSEDLTYISAAASTLALVWATTRGPK